MTTVIRAAGSAEFLALVPVLAGYTPARSLVLLPFAGSRTCGALRIDLPRGAPDEFVRQIVDLAARVERTDAVAVVVYCEEVTTPTRDGLVLPHSILVDALLDGADARGLRIVDALCVTPEGWASYLVDEPVLHPSDTIPAQTGDAHEPIEIDQNAGSELPSADLAARERTARALHALDEAMHEILDGVPPRSGRVHPQALETALLLDDIPALLETALTDLDAAEPFRSAALLWLLNRPVYRDVALVQWARDQSAGAAMLDAQVAFREQGRLPAAEASVILGEGPRPDPGRLREALRLVRMLAACAPRDHRAAALSVAAWLSWALGRSTHADQHLRAATEIAPDYSFARLLRELIDVRPLPDWTFARPAE